MACDHSAILDGMVVSGGEEVTVDKATTTVVAVGVVHDADRCVPQVVLSDGRRITGEAAYYVV